MDSGCVIIGLFGHLIWGICHFLALMTAWNDSYDKLNHPAPIFFWSKIEVLNSYYFSSIMIDFKTYHIKFEISVFWFIIYLDVFYYALFQSIISNHVFLTRFPMNPPISLLAVVEGLSFHQNSSSFSLSFWISFPNQGVFSWKPITLK